MSQSLYTAMSGITAATTSLEVISNNIANINTTAYKSSSVKFSDVFYQTISSGSVATDSTGGTNPVQVGVGTQVSSVTKKFTTGSWQATGSDTDLMIEGSGFFCIQGSDGSISYTRDGNFTFDSNGNLVTSNGSKVLGTSSILSSSSSGNTVRVPLSIGAVVKGTDSTTLAKETLAELNGLGNKNITSGDFNITVTDTAGNVYTGTVKSLENISDSTTTVGVLASYLQNGTVDASGNTLNGLNFTDASGNKVSGIQANIVNGQIQIDTSNATVSKGTVSHGIAKISTSTVGLSNATNFLTVTSLSNTVTNDQTRTGVTNGDFQVTVYSATAGAHTVTVNLSGITANTTAAGAAKIINDAIKVNLTTTDGGTIKGLSASLDANGDLIISGTSATYTPSSGSAETVTSFKFDDASSGTSNFAEKVQMGTSGLTATAAISGTYYGTKTLDYTSSISELTSAAASISATSETINNDGSVQVKYDDGSVLSVQLSADKSNYEFVYTTSNDVQISGSKCAVDKGVADVSNFVIEMATITNTNGLISSGSNSFVSGPNSGDIVYTVAGQMGSGKLESGGLEASNVDMSTELSNMILAQRAIEANSRIFTTTSDVLSTIVNMGR